LHFPLFYFINVGNVKIYQLTKDNRHFSDEKLESQGTNKNL